MRVLVTGAYGFIGAHIVAALQAAGHTPVLAVRGARAHRAFPVFETIACDFGRDTDPAVWRPRLAGIDAVVNCAGILRERGRDTFARVHVETPAALYRACVASNVRRVVQISALGDPADGEFIASKHRGDAQLMATALEWVVLRPSLVYSVEGSYGGTSLLRALAALPLIPVPQKGAQRIQPIAAQDVAAAVVAALEPTQSAQHCLILAGPEAMTLRDYLARLRQWLGFGRARFVSVPSALAAAGAWLGERFGHGPLGMTMWRMLRRGNVAPEGATRMEEILRVRPDPMAVALSKRVASSAERWHAGLYLLAPLLRVTLALTWLAAGVVGLLLPDATVAAIAAPAGLEPATAVTLGRAASLLDLLLGVLLLFGVAVRPVLAAMALSVMAYTVFIGAFLPGHWMDPFGGVVKNGVILVALAIAAATAERS